MKNRDSGRAKYYEDVNHQNINSLRSTLELYDGNGDSVTERDTKVYQSLRSNGNNLSTLIAGEIALDLASKPQNDDEQKLHWLGEANASWQKVIGNSERMKLVNDTTLQAAIYKESLPSYSFILLTKDLPGLAIRNKYNTSLNNIGRAVLDKARQIYNKNDVSHNKNLQERIRMSGLIGELAVLMLLQRFIKNELGDKEQLALFSRFSEDRGINRNKGSSEITAWDISVFQQFEGDSIEMPHKIQVKTTKDHHKRGSVKYSDNISTVYIKEDLAVSHNELQTGFSPTLIMVDLVSEAEGISDDASSRRLRKRTDLLLDAINT